MINKPSATSKFALFMLVVFAPIVTAEHVVQSNVEIKRLGAHEGNTFYLSLKEPFEKPCAYNVTYCIQTNPACQSMLAIATTVKATNLPLREIRYDCNETIQLCDIYLVAIE